jgi:hypothetical protein
LIVLLIGWEAKIEIEALHNEKMPCMFLLGNVHHGNLLASRSCKMKFRGINGRSTGVGGENDVIDRPAVTIIIPVVDVIIATGRVTISLGGMHFTFIDWSEISRISEDCIDAVLTATSAAAQVAFR